MEAPKQINIYDLYRNIKELKNKKNNYYNEVLYKIHEKIKNTTNKGKYKIVYEVPEMVFGVPAYDLNKCMAYLMKELRDNGFLVKYYFPKILYISWDPREILSYKKQKKITAKNFKDLRNNNIKSISNPQNYITQKAANSTSNPNSNIDFSHQEDLRQPTTTQHNTSIFKPILQYDPNNIPTFNYYAYSTTNNNLINEDFYINNKPNNFNDFNKTDNSISAPEHFKQLQFKQLQIQQDENKRVQEREKQYQNEITDYYLDNNEPTHPFKNTIKKYNSQGKFVLDLS